MACQGVVCGSTLSARPTAWNVRRLFIVQADGAGVVDQGVELFHQGDVYATLPQVIGDHQADRAGADDGNVGGQLQCGRSGCKTHGYLRTAFLDFLWGAVWKSRGWWTTKTPASVHQVHSVDLKR